MLVFSALESLILFGEMRSSLLSLSDDDLADRADPLHAGLPRRPPHAAAHRGEPRIRMTALERFHPEQRQRAHPGAAGRALQLGVRRDAHAPDAPLREREARPVERDRAPRLVDRRRSREGPRCPTRASASSARRSGRSSTPREIEKLRHEAITWQLCQFLHGEQGALLATAQIVDSVPWYEGKQYGATQVMDEARHVEVYRRFIQEKLGHEYPVNARAEEAARPDPHATRAGT